MCGIVGYVGDKEAAPILVSGLCNLQYRGYDSAGVALCTADGVRTLKCVGSPENLIPKLASCADCSALCGVGHTRWATHGKPDVVNAHPHSCGRFHVVHNGIIENEKALKEEYFPNTEFLSQTDTEVIARLLQKFCENNTPICEAIQRLIGVLRGSYALGIVDGERPDVLYAVKNKSPLLIGCGEGFNMLGSDTVAMISHTDKFYEICDREYAVITADDFKIYSSNGKEVRREAFVVACDISDCTKGDYAHFMIKEIEEQPRVIRQILSYYCDETGKVNIDNEIIGKLTHSDRIYIIASGTSYNAGLVGKYYFEKICSKPVDVCMAGEFAYNMPPISQSPVFIFVSQSGETADCISVLSKIKELGFASVAITNCEVSTIFREADHTLLIHAGREIAVASTKSYTAQVAVFALLASALNEKYSKLIAKDLSLAADAMEKACSKKEEYREVAHEYLLNQQSCFYIGRGIDYYACLEAALKLKEIAYIQTGGYAASELKHGSIALIEQGTPVFALSTQKITSLHMLSNIEEVKARGGKVLCISSCQSDDEDCLSIECAAELLSPLVSVIPAQYFAYYAALERGCDIDRPRNLAKAVTVE